MELMGVSTPLSTRRPYQFRKSGLSEQNSDFSPILYWQVLNDLPETRGGIYCEKANIESKNPYKRLWIYAHRVDDHPGYDSHRHDSGCTHLFQLLD